MSDDNKYPVDDTLDVVDGTTLFKDDDWWKAAVVFEGYYDDEELSLYLWRNEDGEWKRKQKYNVKSQDDWEDEKEVMDELVDEYLD